SQGPHRRNKGAQVAAATPPPGGATPGRKKNAMILWRERWHGVCEGRHAVPGRPEGLARYVGTSLGPRGSRYSVARPKAAPTLTRLHRRLRDAGSERVLGRRRE